MTFGVVILALAAARVQDESPFRPVPAEAARPLTEAAIQAELTLLARTGDADGATEMRTELRKLRFPRTNGLAQGRRPDPTPIPGVLADPGDYNPRPQEIGKTFRFRLGAPRPGATGLAYGTDVYTGGSGLRAAAEHAGAIGKGEAGVVKVTVLPGQDDYPATSRNGVISRPWGRWSISFRVERD